MLTLSRTKGSSIAARFSRGDKRTCPHSGPPTYWTKLPSSSLKAVRTSSSSSTDSKDNNQRVCVATGGSAKPYHLRTESVRLWCAQLPARVQSLRVGVWHLIVKEHHHAVKIVSTCASNRCSDKDAAVYEVPLIHQ